MEISVTSSILKTSPFTFEEGKLPRYQRIYIYIYISIWHTAIWFGLLSMARGKLGSMLLSLRMTTSIVVMKMCSILKCGY
jgi:hypothetical protein